MQITTFEGGEPRCSPPQSMTEMELAECYGGKIPAGVWWAIASAVIASWGDIREGFSDGVAGKPPRY